MLAGVRDRIEKSIGRQLMTNDPHEVVSLGGGRFLITSDAISELTGGDEYRDFRTTDAVIEQFGKNINASIQHFGNVVFSGHSYWLMVFNSDSDKIAFMFSQLSALQELRPKYSTFIVKNKS